MASAGVIPRSVYQTRKPQSARGMRTVNSGCGKVPVIPHPMASLGDVSELRITGTASPEVRCSRPQTASGYPLNIATCVSWSESDLVSTKQRRYVKKALVTGTRVDKEMLELVTERLVDGFQGIRQMFRARDPSGGETVSRENLLRIMYNLVGHIDNDAFDRMLLNLGLNKKDKISFDMFVSRFSEIEDVRKQWSTPVKRAAERERQQGRHPEDTLRDCGVQDWAQLKVAPHAAQILITALRQGKVDLRGLLPDECFQAGRVVSKLQMRYALLDLGVNMTDTEYRRFWEKFDRKNAGFVTIQELYSLLNLTPEGEPKKAPPRPKTAAPAGSQDSGSKKTSTTKPLQRAKSCVARGSRPAAKAAREFSLNRHRDDGPGGGAHGKKKGGGGEKCGPGGVLVGDSFRVEGIRPQSARLPDRRDVLLPEGMQCGDPQDDLTDAVARSKIRALMLQKRQQPGKFDSVRDCLNHKFEENYVSLSLAFKLFDIHEDGHVMHIDFRRVLKEFGFPVSAIQLGRLVHRFGVIMKHGLIGYKQLLTKLFSQTDGLTSQIMDDFLQARLDGVGMETGSVDDTDEDAIARSVIEFLHHDYLDMALFLLRSDRRNRGVLPAADVRSAVERCLGYTLTDRQWAELQVRLPRDPDGSVRYVDFLLSFGNGPPGAWNLQTVGQVSVPRNKVVYEPTEEVRRLERARSDLGPLALPRQDEHRPLNQLRQELDEFFAHHVHEVEQKFRELDRKSHKGFSQWQFGALLNLCGFPMTDHELASFWLSLKLDDDLSTFEDVVRQFLPSYGLHHTTTGTSASLADKENRTRQTTFSRHAVYGGSTTRRTLRTTGTGTLPIKRAATAHARTTPSPFLTQAMMKAKPVVLNNWEYLRQGFRNNDPNGLGSVPFQQMQRLVSGLRTGLSQEELGKLCEEFDFRKNGRCNYMAFMKSFSPKSAPGAQMAYDPRVHVLDKKPLDASDPITVNDALVRIRKRLIKQYKSLRRGFTSHDRSKRGSLSAEDFRRVLGDCSIPASDQDVYHLMSEFDADMDGRVSYQEFLDALLRMG